MEILNVYKVADIPTTATWLLILFLIGGAALTFVCILQLLEKEYVKAIACFVFALVCVGLLVLFGKYFNKYYNKERYEVKIDNTLSAVELVENWDIIEVRGDILVLERKEDNGK